MKAKELRVGNYMFNVTLNKDVQITPVNFSSSYFDDPDYSVTNFTSIALTEEWLLRFGWDRESESISLPGSDALIISEKDCTSVRLMDTAGNYISKSFSYVHELQNLYFGVTGEELTIDSSNNFTDY